MNREDFVTVYCTNNALTRGVEVLKPLNELENNHVATLKSLDWVHKKQGIRVYRKGELEGWVPGTDWFFDVHTATLRVLDKIDRAIMANAKRHSALLALKKKYIVKMENI